MKTYLSVDLDYWREDKDSSNIDEFINRLLKLKKKIVVVKHHDGLLKHINKSKCKHIINIDFHSDIADIKDSRYGGERGELNEGTWVNFIKWQRGGIFEWRYPSIRCCTVYYGYCHVEKNPFIKKHKATDWGCVTKKKGIVNVIENNNIQEIGISISREWWNGNNKIYKNVMRKIKGFEK